MSNPLIITTTAEVSGRKIVSHLGLIVGVGTVAFGPITTTKTKRALLKAMNQAKGSATELKADGIVGVTISATSSGFAFSRGHTVIVSGTAVKFE
jgi:uncharacterized protein YbjQ (UPF0145 family)